MYICMRSCNAWQDAWRHRWWCAERTAACSYTATREHASIGIAACSCRTCSWRILHLQGIFHFGFHTLHGWLFFLPWLHMRYIELVCDMICMHACTKPPLLRSIFHLLHLTHHLRLTPKSQLKSHHHPSFPQILLHECIYVQHVWPAMLMSMHARDLADWYQHKCIGLWFQDHGVCEVASVHACVCEDMHVCMHVNECRAWMHAATYMSACMVMNSCMNVPSNMQVTWQCERTWRWASWPSEIASYALYLNPCMCMQTHHFIHACHMTTHKHTAERKENTEPRNCKSLCTSASTGWKTDKQPVPQHPVLVLPQAFGQPIQWRFCFCSSGLSFIDLTCMTIPNHQAMHFVHARIFV